MTTKHSEHALTVELDDNPVVQVYTHYSTGPNPTLHVLIEGAQGDKPHQFSLNYANQSLALKTASLYIAEKVKEMGYNNAEILELNPDEALPNNGNDKLDTLVNLHLHPNSEKNQIATVTGKAPVYPVHSSDKIASQYEIILN